ncbi:hypothetical protein GCM10027592_29530 [Spirosoma flavus]
MGVENRATPSSIKAHFENIRQNIRRIILNNLRYLGEQCVNIARSVNTYRDQTGNLRNSVGYVIIYNGQVVEENFEPTANPTSTGGGGPNGLQVGRDYAMSLIANFPAGYVLIVVAGMEYASDVEAKGKDVLTSAELYAEAELPRMLTELKIDIQSIR